MNVHEERFWKQLVELGAKEITLGGKHALDLRPIRVTSERKLAMFCQAVVEVVGRSNANRRHVDRRGCPVYVVTDYYTVGWTGHERHEPETRALIGRPKRTRKST